MTAAIVSAERLRELLHYDPETGHFTRLVSRPHSKVGDVAGCLNNQGYHRICIDYRDYQAHRLAWLYVHGVWPAHQIDHIDLDRANNRLANLREATKAQNSQNLRDARANSKSGFLGVSQSKQAGKWRARIMLDGKEYRLGRFASADLAHAAYVQAKRELHPMGTI